MASDTAVLPTVGYWDIRALGNPIRFLLKHVGQDFEDKRYRNNRVPDRENDEWFRMKYDLGLDFPNLPYYIEGDVKITQSTAIMQYLGRKHGLCADTEEALIRQDMVLQQGRDMFSSLAGICFTPDPQQKLPALQEESKIKLKQLDLYLGDRKWFAGEKLTYADFVLYEVLDTYRALLPGCLHQCQDLQRFLDKFELLPNIKSYMESAEFLRRPYFNRRANYGGDD